MSEQIKGYVCKVCGHRFGRPVPDKPGVCWVCATGGASTSATGEPQPLSPPVPAQAAKLLDKRPEYHCPACGVDYYRPFDAHNEGLCWECAKQKRLKAERRARRLDVCGVAPRYRELARWSKLKGPPKYQQAVQRVRWFAERGTSIMCVIGPRGTGKSQCMAAAVVETILAGKSAKHVHVADLVDDLKARFGRSAETSADWREAWSRPHLLVVDEVGELAAGDVVRTQFTSLLAKRYEHLRPTILVANLDRAELAELVGSSVMDRCCEGGGVVEFAGWPSFRRSAPQRRT